MERFVLAWLVSIAALYVASVLVKEIRIKGFGAAALAALALEIASLLVPVVVRHLPPPLHVLPTDVCRFLVFALLLWIIGRTVPGFRVQGPSGAVVGALVLAIMQWLLAFVPHLRIG
jgi:putative membrane protein